MRSTLSWDRSPVMRSVVSIVHRVADCDATVLVTGESGVGKEVVARELHRRSARADRPFVKVNCAAVPGDLLESEMFGHEKGAFTGAQSATAGKFEAAAGGTLMLDEIADMPALLQAKLLHVLDDGQFSKLGGNAPLVASARVVAATNHDLPARILEGLFREDLYYRLQVIEIRVPPLRERREEIRVLAEEFLADFAQRSGRNGVRLSSALIDGLVAYDWPGNVRELENVVQRFAILGDESRVLSELRASAASRDAMRDGGEADLAASPAAAGAAGSGAETEHEGLPARVRRATDAVEREVIERVLRLVQWNRRRAAEELGVSYKTLLNKAKSLGIDPVRHAVDSES